MNILFFYMYVYKKIRVLDINISKFMGKRIIFCLKSRNKSQEITVSVAAFFFQLGQIPSCSEKHKMSKILLLLFRLAKSVVIVCSPSCFPVSLAVLNAGEMN